MSDYLNRKQIAQLQLEVQQHLRAVAFANARIAEQEKELRMLRAAVALRNAQDALIESEALQEAS